MRRNTLTNMIMSNKRKDAVYQTLITDLVLLGYLAKEEGEALLGYKIPAHLRLPKEAERFQNVLNVEGEEEEDDNSATTSTLDADDTTSTLDADDTASTLDADDTITQDDE